MPASDNARPNGRAISDREARAIAYSLVDEIETRARALMASDATLDFETAAMRALLAMAAN